ncbi:putative small nuclear ribonucleoprotein E [Cucurbita argyrosperma subsp. argyrosperma]|nr:putative small nuclear ribonucleoprotein E [Cucurbita argyrosperma subsp. argyrosperma]
MASTKVQRIMTQPIGFDEYMNLVLDDAEEVNIKKKSKKTLGRILLKGDNITLMMNTQSWKWESEAGERQQSTSSTAVVGDWTTNRKRILEITQVAGGGTWSQGIAPFRSLSCGNLEMAIVHNTLNSMTLWPSRFLGKPGFYRCLAHVSLEYAFSKMGSQIVH